MKFTKLQTEFADRDLSKGAYVAFPLSIFKSDEYKRWKRERRKNNMEIRHNKQQTL